MVPKANLVGLNHVAIEVDDVEEALRFYGEVFSFRVRGSHRDDEGRLAMAFIDMGDQFLAISRDRTQPPDAGRHFGLVVDDRSSVMDRAKDAGAQILKDRDFNFLDPWGNHIEVVAYSDVQYSKVDAVLTAMGLELGKTAEALQELRQKGVNI